MSSGSTNVVSTPPAKKQRKDSLGSVSTEPSTAVGASSATTTTHPIVSCDDKKRKKPTRKTPTTPNPKSSAATHKATHALPVLSLDDTLEQPVLNLLLNLVSAALVAGQEMSSSVVHRSEQVMDHCEQVLADIKTLQLNRSHEATMGAKTVAMTRDASASDMMPPLTQFTPSGVSTQATPITSSSSSPHAIARFRPLEGAQEDSTDKALNKIAGSLKKLQNISSMIQKSVYKKEAELIQRVTISPATYLAIGQSLERPGHLNSGAASSSSISVPFAFTTAQYAKLEHWYGAHPEPFTHEILSMVTMLGLPPYAPTTLTTSSSSTVSSVASSATPTDAPTDALTTTSVRQWFHDRRNHEVSHHIKQTLAAAAAATTLPELKRLRWLAATEMQATLVARTTNLRERLPSDGLLEELNGLMKKQKKAMKLAMKQRVAAASRASTTTIERGGEGGDGSSSSPEDETHGALSHHGTTANAKTKDSPPSEDSGSPDGEEDDEEDEDMMDPETVSDDEPPSEELLPSDHDVIDIVKLASLSDVKVIQRRLVQLCAPLKDTDVIATLGLLRSLDISASILHQTALVLQLETLCETFATRTRLVHHLVLLLRTLTQVLEMAEDDKEEDLTMALKTTPRSTLTLKSQRARVVTPLSSPKANTRVLAKMTAASTAVEPSNLMIPPPKTASASSRRTSLTPVASPSASPRSKLSTETSQRASTSSEKPNSRKHVLFSKEQLEALERWYDADPRPNGARMEEMVATVNTEAMSSSVSSLPLGGTAESLVSSQPFTTTQIRRWVYKRRGQDKAMLKKMTTEVQGSSKPLTTSSISLAEGEKGIATALSSSSVSVLPSPMLSEESGGIVGGNSSVGMGVGEAEEMLLTGEEMMNPSRHLRPLLPKSSVELLEQLGEEEAGMDVVPVAASSVDPNISVKSEYMK